MSTPGARPRLRQVGRELHRQIPPQEAPQAFAQAVIDVDAY
jgi:hypothetical protein